MTAKEYLHQAYRLDHKINSDIGELGMLHDMSVSISAPQFGERLQTSAKKEAPFQKSLERIFELEDRIRTEINMFITLKKEMRDVIETVDDTDEKMVLRYRYIHNMTWEQIAAELHADKSTVRRWHGEALAHVTIPDEPTKV